MGNILGVGQSEADYLVAELSARMDEATRRSNLLRLRIPMQAALAATALAPILQQLADSGIRIVVVYVRGQTLKQLLRMAAQRGMMRDPYVWVGSGSNMGPASGSGFGDGTVSSGGQGLGLCSKGMVDWLGDLTPSIPTKSSNDGRVIPLYSTSNIGASTAGAASYVYQADLTFSSSPLLGSICFTPGAPSTPAFTNIKYRLAEKGLPFDSTISPSDAATYDAIGVFVQTLALLLGSGVPYALSSDGSGAAFFPASTVFETMKNVSFFGLSGMISFNKDGDRYGSVDMYNYDPLGAATGAFVKRATWNEAGEATVPVSDALTGRTTLLPAFLYAESTIWPDATLDLPQDFAAKFEDGASISFSYGGAILGLLYLFLLLPSALLVFNVRPMVKSFLDAAGSDAGIWSQIQEWGQDYLKAFSVLAVAGIFCAQYLTSVWREGGSSKAQKAVRGAPVANEQPCD